MYPNMEKKLFKHLMKKRNVGALISRQYVQAKARKIAQRQCFECSFFPRLLFDKKFKFK